MMNLPHLFRIAFALAAFALPLAACAEPIGDQSVAVEDLKNGPGHFDSIFQCNATIRWVEYPVTTDTLRGPADNTPGSLDKTFGSNGVVFFGSQGDTGTYNNRLLPHPDGSITWQIGWNGLLGRFNSQGRLMQETRLRPDNQHTSENLPMLSGVLPDDTPGEYLCLWNSSQTDQSRLTCWPLDNASSPCKALHFEDGAIALASSAKGVFWISTYQSDDDEIQEQIPCQIWRLGQDKQIDRRYGRQGSASTKLPLQELYRMFLLPKEDGSVTAVAIGSGVSYDVVSAFRVDRHGQIDSRYRNGGQLLEVGHIEDALLQPDGKLLLCGGTWGGENPGNSELLLIRLNEDGKRDHTFGKSGQVVQAFQPRGREAQRGPDHRIRDTANALALQLDGKILIAGEMTCQGKRFAVVFRYLPSGTLDAAFGVGGIAVIHACPETNWSIAEQMILQPDGKIVVSGTCDQAGKSKAWLARINP